MNPDKDDLEYVGFLEDLVSDKRLEGAALGIAKQAIDKGPISLSESQGNVLRAAIKEFITEKCAVCHQSIPWAEMFQAIDSGTCTACART